MSRTILARDLRLWLWSEPAQSGGCSAEHLLIPTFRGRVIYAIRGAAGIGISAGIMLGISGLPLRATTLLPVACIVTMVPCFGASFIAATRTVMASATAALYCILIMACFPRTIYTALTALALWSLIISYSETSAIFKRFCIGCTCLTLLPWYGYSDVTTGAEVAAYAGEIFGSVAIGATIGVLILLVPMPYVSTASWDLRARIAKISRSLRNEVVALVITFTESGVIPQTGDPKSYDEATDRSGAEIESHEQSELLHEATTAPVVTAQSSSYSSPSLTSSVRGDQLRGPRTVASPLATISEGSATASQARGGAADLSRSSSSNGNGSLALNQRRTSASLPTDSGSITYAHGINDISMPKGMLPRNSLNSPKSGANEAAAPVSTVMSLEETNGNDGGSGNSSSSSVIDDDDAVLRTTSMIALPTSRTSLIAPTRVAGHRSVSQQEPLHNFNIDHCAAALTQPHANSHSRRNTSDDELTTAAATTPLQPLALGAVLHASPHTAAHGPIRDGRLVQRDGPAPSQIALNHPAHHHRRAQHGGGGGDRPQGRGRALTAAVAASFLDLSDLMASGSSPSPMTAAFTTAARGRNERHGFSKASAAAAADTGRLRHPFRRDHLVNAAIVDVNGPRLAPAADHAAPTTRSSYFGKTELNVAPGLSTSTSVSGTVASQQQPMLPKPSGATKADAATSASLSLLSSAQPARASTTAPSGIPLAPLLSSLPPATGSNAHLTVVEVRAPLPSVYSIRRASLSGARFSSSDGDDDPAASYSTSGSAGATPLWLATERVPLLRADVVDLHSTTARDISAIRNALADLKYEPSLPWATSTWPRSSSTSDLESLANWSRAVSRMSRIMAMGATAEVRGWITLWRWGRQRR